MDITALHILCAEGEGDLIEFKRDTSSPRFEESFCRTVCAFANDLADRREAGYFLIGIDDDGAISGYRDTSQDEERISNWISTWKVTPKPAVTIETIKSDAGDVIVVSVDPASYPTWFNKEMWVRVGKSTRKADLTDMLRANIKSKPQSFDGCPVPNTALADMAANLYVAYEESFVSPEIIEANHRTIFQKYVGQGFANPHSERPTYAGLLMCGREPQRHMPLAYIQFLRTRATDLGDRLDILDHKEIKGDIANQMREVDSLLRANIETWTQPFGLETQHIESYPRDAIRELVLNAVLHRDYSMASPIRFYWYANRIEIWNPGGLFQPATPDQFPYISSYRNPLLASALRNLGYIEKFGSGVQIAQTQLARKGNEPAQFEFHDSYVKVTLFARQKIA